MQIYPVKRMIRDIGDEMSSTYSQTFNGYDVAVALLNRDCDCMLQVGHFW